MKTVFVTEKAKVMIHADASLVEPVSEPTQSPETIEQRLDRIEQQRQEDKLMQLEVMASIYEEILNKGV